MSSKNTMLRTLSIRCVRFHDHFISVCSHANTVQQSFLVCMLPLQIYYQTASACSLSLFPALSKLGTSISSDKNLIPLIVLDFSAFLKMLTRTVHAIPDKVLSESCIRTNSLSLWKNCFGSISTEI